LISPLANAQIDDYRRDGFLVLRGLFSETECATLRAAVDELAAPPQAPGGARWYSDDEAAAQGRVVLSRVEYFRSFHEGLRDVMASPKLLEPLRQLLGEPAVLFKDKINYKIPGSSGFEPHQDAQAGWDRYCRTQVTALVSLDATTHANGCLELARGRHTTGLLGEMWKPLSDASLEGVVFEALETAPGDVCFFGQFVPHRSGANRTDSPRRVLYLTYNPASEGDHYETYFADKRRSYPPDIERPQGQERRYRV
jgi:ectoine hydroxylase-related dioxygenase (phytanoyl-CoA dioxygenase family)